MTHRHDQQTPEPVPAGAMLEPQAARALELQSAAAIPAPVLALHLSLQTSELASRMRQRLADLAEDAPVAIVWKRDGLQVLIRLDSLVVRTLDGWLLCELELDSDQTRAATLQFVLYLGGKDDRRGVHASSTINAPELAAAQLADTWGADLQRVLWDAVLDAVEAAVEQAAEANPGVELTLSGFYCDDEALRVDLLTGEI